MKALPQFEQAMRLRLKNRLARLARLAELDAPIAILVNECLLVMKALAGADQEAYGQGLASAAFEEAKNAAGFCTSQGCDNEAPIPIRFCAKCAEECAAEEAKEEDHVD